MSKDGITALTAGRPDFIPYMQILALLILLMATPVKAANIYEAVVTQTIDGDSFRVNLEVWPEHHIQTNIRVSGVDTPELNGKCDYEKDLALKAKAFTSSLMVTGRIVFLTNVKPDKFGGRYNADVYLHPDMKSWMKLSDMLIEAGLARPYRGQKRSSWC